MKIEGSLFGDWVLCSGIHKEPGVYEVFILWMRGNPSLTRIGSFITCGPLHR